MWIGFSIFSLLDPFLVWLLQFLNWVWSNFAENWHLGWLNGEGIWGYSWRKDLYLQVLWYSSCSRSGCRLQGLIASFSNSFLFIYLFQLIFHTCELFCSFSCSVFVDFWLCLSMWCLVDSGWLFSVRIFLIECVMLVVLLWEIQYDW